MGVTIGVLGGMGPMTTIDFARMIIENTSAKIDQEHLRMLIYINPQIPSRVDAIANGAASPLPELIASAKKLEQAGASFIIIPCNTAHYWYEELCKSVSIPVYNFIEMAVAEIALEFNKEGVLPTKGILLLATDATCKIGLYQKVFDRYALTLKLPDNNEQAMITNAINEVKAGKIEDNQYIQPIEKLVLHYQSKGINTLLAGCTEVSLLFPYIYTTARKLNPLEVVARKMAGV